MNPNTARLARAATLQVRPITMGKFEVTGGEQAHLVSHPQGALCAGADHRVWCDRADFRRGHGLRACKHILAVAITQASDEDRAAIAALLGIG